MSAWIEWPPNPARINDPEWQRKERENAEANTRFQSDKYGGRYWHFHSVEDECECIARADSECVCGCHVYLLRPIGRKPNETEKRQELIARGKA